MGRPLGMKGDTHHQVSNFNKSEHFWGLTKAFEILGNLGVDPLLLGFGGKKKLCPDRP
jgi:hypothetical protein